MQNFLSFISLKRIHSGPLKGLSTHQLLLALVMALVLVLIIRLFFKFETPTEALVLRAVIAALAVLLAFTLASNIPIRWLPRHAIRFIAIAIAAPVGLAGGYLLTLPDRAPGKDYWPAFIGWSMMSGVAVTMGLIATLIYIYLERDREAREAALKYELQASQLQQAATSAQLSALQAQIEPHFLFNTLANVQQLVETSSPRAAPLLAHLIDYLKSTLAQTREGGATLAGELNMVRNYLHIMAMRMPDRLRFSVDAPGMWGATKLPALSLLTLVENAVQHGIDPDEHGGEIAVRVGAEGTTLVFTVADTGVGLRAGAADGVGLSNLRSRLAMAFGDAANVTLARGTPRGCVATLRIPIQSELST
jgi:signal transduction histidine kinase